MDDVSNHSGRPKYRQPMPTHYGPAPHPTHHQPTHYETAQPEHKQQKAKKLRFVNRKRWLFIGIGLVIIVLFSVLIYGYVTTRNQLENARNPSSDQTQADQLINSVSKLAQLPTNEAPTVATVNDASKLKSQVFFANAKNGDKVLIYSKSGVAVLYRPSTNKIIQYSLINSGTSSTTNSGTTGH